MIVSISALYEWLLRKSYSTIEVKIASSCEVIHRFILFVYQSFVSNLKYSSLSTNIIGIPAKTEKAYLTQGILVVILRALPLNATIVR